MASLSSCLNDCWTPAHMAALHSCLLMLVNIMQIYARKSVGYHNSLEYSISAVMNMQILRAVRNAESENYLTCLTSFYTLNGVFFVGFIIQYNSPMLFRKPKTFHIKKKSLGIIVMISSATLHVNWHNYIHILAHMTNDLEPVN